MKQESWEAFKCLKIENPSNSKDTQEDNEKCNSCGKPTELMDYDDGSGVPIDYRHEGWKYQCTHCGFEQVTYRNFYPSGHWTGD